jgi:hypothetical protein
MRKVFLGVVGAVAACVIAVVVHGGVAAIGSGGEGHYAFLQTDPKYGGPVTYSSCRSIPVEFNLHGVDDPDTTRQVLLQALGEASAASHLNLVYSGDSPRRPRSNWGTLYGYPVLIAFADASEIASMDGVGGRGGSSWTEVNGRETYVSGQIVMERLYWNRELHAGHGTDITRSLVMHELGHILGLGHVDDRHEIMNPSAGPTHWGPGDRKGLALLGKGPCS